MAERRMFAKTIIDSDAFLDMPVTARLLYYDLAMRADDDGFVNSPKKIMRMIGASQDDLGILVMRKFILPFENGVVVIKHWRIHNYIQNDRHKETEYKEQLAMLELDENKSYRFKKEAVDGTDTKCIQTVYKPETQVRIGKDRLEEKENIKEKETTILADFEEAWKAYPRKERRRDAQTAYIAARKEGEDKDTILAGIAKYKAKIAAEKTPPKYIAQGGTWFHQRRWTDEYTVKGQNFNARTDYSKYDDIYEEGQR